MTTHVRAALLLLLSVIASSHPAFAGGLYFSRVTDTVEISGSITVPESATYEAVLRVQVATPNNYLFLAYNPGLGIASTENKHLFVGPNLLAGYSHPNGMLTRVKTEVVPLYDSFHHIAYVVDSKAGNERLYIDGNPVASRGLSETLNNKNGALTLGAFVHNALAGETFSGGATLGWLDSFRVSNIARYPDNSFSPPVGDLVSDGNTLLLYNFNDSPGSTTISDESGNGHTGVLGTGFRGATLPSFVSVPEPSTLALAGFGAFGLFAVWARGHSWRLRPSSWSPPKAAAASCGIGSPSAHRYPHQEPPAQETRNL